MTERKKIALLAVSVGTTRPQALADLTAMEQALTTAFPGAMVLRAFTNRHIRAASASPVDSVEQALKRALAAGVRRVAVQPTCLLDGAEYRTLTHAAALAAQDFAALAVGEPLLTTPQDEADLAEVLTAQDRRLPRNTAAIWVGHGNGSPTDSAYLRLQQLLWQRGCADSFVGTLEGVNPCAQVLAEVKKAGYTRAVLRPLMLTAGVHACRDMAGESATSWQSDFSAAGLETTCSLQGLGRLPGVQQLCVRHARTALTAAENA